MRTAFWAASAIGISYLTKIYGLLPLDAFNVLAVTLFTFSLLLCVYQDLLKKTI